jgi:hypothetical protein
LFTIIIGVGLPEKAVNECSANESGSSTEPGSNN